MATTTKPQANHHPLHQLQQQSQQWNTPLNSKEFTRLADNNDPLSQFRSHFHFPKIGDLPLAKPRDQSEAAEDSMYLCGNSLGLMPRSVQQHVDRQLQQWASYGVFGHRHGFMPWAFCDEWLLEDMAAVVGAEPSEICMMNGLSVNLHVMLTAFYQPEVGGRRTKVLLERQAFPSDHYAIESQIKMRGLDPEVEMVCLCPREGEFCIRNGDVLQKISEIGDEISLILLPGIQYYTGQLFNMASITAAGHSKGCTVGWDLAHAVGNVPMQLHNWEADFAVWCSYKYLSSGAGCLAGAFLHQRHHNGDLRQMEGWWGHRIETRFDMNNRMEPSEGAGRLRMSNPSMIQAACVRAALDEFKLAGMPAIRRKSLLLTAYLEHLLLVITPEIRVITPSCVEERGAQLSLLLARDVEEVVEMLVARGVACDERKPNVIRVAPCPLYNSFTDVRRFVLCLREVLSELGA